MKLIIAGGREFNDANLMRDELNKLVIGHGLKRGDIEVVCGLARGADNLGKQLAEARGIKVAEFPADWDTHGKSAGYKRNEQMAHYADTLIAFWDGESRGTQHMITLASKLGLEVKVVRY